VGCRCIYIAGIIRGNFAHTVIEKEVIMKKEICNIKRIVRGQSATDGAGVKLNRIIATPDIDYIDPFVLLDELKSDNPDDFIAGFPMHPHRGIETITYMIHGNFKVAC
jgi:redox-sensitive bicupin YhaK (pirin superfamily)